MMDYMLLIGGPVRDAAVHRNTFIKFKNLFGKLIFCWKTKWFQDFQNKIPLLVLLNYWQALWWSEDIRNMWWLFGAHGLLQPCENVLRSHCDTWSQLFKQSLTLNRNQRINNDSNGFIDNSDICLHGVVLSSRFINARRRIVQPMIDQSNRAGKDGFIQSTKD